MNSNITQTVSNNADEGEDALSRASSVSSSSTSVSTTAAQSPADTDKTYQQLKRKLKTLVDLNMTLNKDYIHAKKEIRALKYERNVLLDNIDRIESIDRLTDDSSDDSDTLMDSDISDSSDDDYDFESRLKAKAKLKASTPTTILQKLASKRHTNNKNIISTPTSTLTTNDTSTIATSTSTNNSITSNNHPTSSSIIRTTIPSAPPKRSKINTSKLKKVRRVQPIERDEQGKPKLPQIIGVLTVHSLGKIITDRPAYHNERYIFPVGYTVSRTYPSMIDPDKNTVVTSTILDGGDAPRFHVVAADLPDEPIIANSATGAWTVIVRRANDIRHRDHSNSASGPDYYGFKHPTIANLIQELPGARQLQNYVWQEFEEMEPRAAKGVLAAAEKKRGNLEQMGNANRKILKTPKTTAMREAVPATSTMAPQQQPNEKQSSSSLVFVNEIPVHNEDDEEETDELIATDDEE